MHRIAIIAAFWFSLQAAQIAAAAAPAPPSWRGQVRTTFQEWSFSTSAPTSPASPCTNPYGTPYAAVVIGPCAAGWLDSYPAAFGSRQGYWDLGSSGTITVQLPSVSPLIYKEVWVQSIYLDDITEIPVVSVSDATETGSQIGTVEVLSSGGYWRAKTTMWGFSAKVSEITVTLASDLMWGATIDQVTIDALLELPCDVNNDCRVNILDLIEVRNHLALDPNSGDNRKADVNNDGAINLLDLLKVRDMLNAQCK